MPGTTNPTPGAISPEASQRTSTVANAQRRWRRSSARWTSTRPRRRSRSHDEQHVYRIEGGLDRARTSTTAGSNESLMPIASISRGLDDAITGLDVSGS